MKKNIESNKATFIPQAYKTFEGALEAFFSTECPQLGGFRTRQVLVKSVMDMVNQLGAVPLKRRCIPTYQ